MGVGVGASDVTPEDSLDACPDCERTIHETWGYCPRCGAGLDLEGDA